MSSPPATAATPRSLPGYGETANLRVISREFDRVLRVHGFNVTTGLVRVLAQKFLADGFSNPAEVDAYVLWYADPTGEAAVARALRKPAKS
jgi:hypothetical protein